MHEFTLISTIAAGFGLALVLGYAANRAGAPPLVGYLLAGILIGPATPGFVADMALTSELAEIGVMLMMFGVGLHFSIPDLMAVQRIAIPGAVVQIAAATGLAALTAHFWGWSWGASLVFGIALSVASTVVLLRALESRRALNTVNGRIAVGWLIVEDLFVVLVLVVLPAVAGLLGGTPPGGHEGDSVGRAIGVTLAKVAAFVALMLVVGRRVLPKVLWLVARTGSRELFTLAIVSAACGEFIRQDRSPVTLVIDRLEAAAVKSSLFSGTLQSDVWTDNSVFSDTGRVTMRLIMKDGKVATEQRYLGDPGERIRNVRQAPDGSIYLLTDARNGQILRVTPAAKR